MKTQRSGHKELPSLRFQLCLTHFLPLSVWMMMKQPESSNISKVDGWSKSFPMTTGNRHHSCYCRGRELAEWGVSEDDALNYLLGFADTDFTKDEITRQVKDAYKNTTSAGKVGSKYRVL